MSLRSRLSVLVAIAAAPSLALVAYNTVQWRDFLERQAGDDALASARMVSAELSQLLEGTRHLMVTVTRHPSVPDDEAGCAEYFKSVIKAVPVYREAALIDRDGRFRCSTIQIPPALDVRDRVYFAEPLKTGQLTVGTITTGRVTGERSLHISMPFQSPDKRFDGVVVFILNPDRVANDFVGRAWPSNHRLSVLDRQGSLVFTVPPTEDVAARAITREAFESTYYKQPRNTMVVREPNGTEAVVGFVGLDEDPKGLFVAVSVDLDVALAQLWETAWRSTILAIIAILFALLGTTLAAAYLFQRPVLAMLDTARRREAGDNTAQFPRLSRGSELGLLSNALADMSAKVDGLLEQKEFLMRELQHRVMNSLQILSSLLLMQSRHAADPATQEQLQQARERVLSMGTVYRHLYRTETVGPVEFGEFLRLICAESERAYAGTSKATITCEAEPLFVPGGTATSLAVLMHELITNALKHAYPENEAGPIVISLTRTKRGRIEFRVADRGRGMPEDVDLEAPTSLGLKVITSTVRRFGGTLSINRLDPGTEFVIRFPADLEAQEAAE
jgi:two-component sensor histidine kinase